MIALIVLAVEGYLLYGYYDRYDVQASPGTGVSVLGEDTTGRTATGSADAEGLGASEATVPPDVETLFVHRATNANSRGDYTYLSDASIDGDPDAVVLAGPSRDGASSADAAYGHNVGVWFEPAKKKWAIFNQDRLAVPAGTAFEVTVPRSGQGFVHRAAFLTIVGNITYLDDPLLNGKPDAEVTVTQNWNPGGGGGVYNDHPVGVGYDEEADEWFVYNRDGAPMPQGAAFNVFVSGATGPAR